MFPLKLQVLMFQDLDSSPNKDPISISRNRDSLDSRLHSDLTKLAIERKMPNQKKKMEEFKELSEMELSGELR